MAKKTPQASAPTTVASAMEVLERVVTGAKAAPGYVFTSEAEHKELLANGLVEANPDMKDDSGRLATRPTAEGVTKIENQTVNTPVIGTQPAETNGVAHPRVRPLVSGVANAPVPEFARRQTRPEFYPFSQLEKDQSFFVAATTENPEPEKTFASTIASAKNRFAKPTGQKRKNRKGEEVEEMEFDRDFKMAAIKDGAAAGFGEQFKGMKGIGVWRVK